MPLTILDSTSVTVAAVVVATGLVYSLMGKRRNVVPPSYPEVPTTSNSSSTNGTNGNNNNKVCVLGAGTIGSSFTSVFLSKGMKVVNYDPFATREVLEKRVKEYWPVLVARGVTKMKDPPFDLLEFQTQNLQQAVHNVDFVQECTWENVESKQSILKELDEIVDSSTIIASSTSFIPWQLLAEQCHHKHRIMIGHPAIPHTHSFMEIYSIAPAWAQHCAEWYKQAGFDVIIMKQTIPGHVFNSFLHVNMKHGLGLVRRGICTAEDVNTAMRHFGRDLYARHGNVALFTTIGGDRGLQGGMELSKRIQDDAIYLILFSGMKQRGWPNCIASPIGKYLGRFIAHLIPPIPEEWLDACKTYEKTITQDGKIPVQTACFEATKEMYVRIPFEPDNDPLKLPSKK